MVWLEYFGVITGLLYLFLEIKQHKAMWVVGFLTSLVYVFVFLSAKIYADMGLQTYYVGISIYGFYQWTRKKHEIHTENDSLPSDCILYTSEPSAFRGDYRNIGRCIRHLMVSPSSIHGLSHPRRRCVHHVGRHCRYLDAGKANYRVLDFWVIVNLVSVYLYYLRGLYPTMLLYFCYATLAIVGYYNWRKKGKSFEL